MNKVGMMKACLNGEVCVDGESKYRFDEYEGLQVCNKPFKDNEWENIYYEELALAFDGYEIYTEPKREFNIKPTDWVLVRHTDEMEWYLRNFSHIELDSDGCFAVTVGSSYYQIAPYKGNESKLNTIDDIENKFTKSDIEGRVDCE